MLMLELLAAATVAAAPTPAPPQPFVIRPDSAATARCDGVVMMSAEWNPASQDAKAQRLADLPKADFERTVNRRVDGCVKRVIVSYGAGK